MDLVTSWGYIGYPFSYSLTDLRNADFVSGKVRWVNYRAGLSSFVDGNIGDEVFSVNSVVAPVNKIMLCEEDPVKKRRDGNGDTDGGAWDPWLDPTTDRHNGRGTFLMVDGHAESQKPLFATQPEHYSPRYSQ